MTTLTQIGGPTAIIEYAGFTFLTDPTFDEPREYDFPTGNLVKTQGPAMAVDQLPQIDAVLLSHDEHPDNLDVLGRELVETGDVPVLGTPESAGRVSTITGLRAGEQRTLRSADRDPVTITAVPGRHGPEGSEAYVGTVTGFVLSAPGLESVYVSGDNASVDMVHQVVDQVGQVGIAVLFCGAARIGLFDNAELTLTGRSAAEAAQILKARVVVPIHADSWAHFSESTAEVSSAFSDVGLGERLRLPEPGKQLQL